MKKRKRGKYSLGRKPPPKAKKTFFGQYLTIKRNPDGTPTMRFGTDSDFCWVLDINHLNTSCRDCALGGFCLRWICALPIQILHFALQCSGEELRSRTRKKVPERGLLAARWCERRQQIHIINCQKEPLVIPLDSFNFVCPSCSPPHGSDDLARVSKHPVIALYASLDSARYEEEIYLCKRCTQIIRVSKLPPPLKGAPYGRSHVPIPPFVKVPQAGAKSIAEALFNGETVEAGIYSEIGSSPGVYSYAPTHVEDALEYFRLPMNFNSKIQGGKVGVCISLTMDARRAVFAPLSLHVFSDWISPNSRRILALALEERIYEVWQSEDLPLDFLPGCRLCHECLSRKKELPGE